MKRVLVVIVIVLLSGFLFCQEADRTKDNKNSIELSGGICLGEMRDMGVSPLYYNNLIPLVGVRYSGINEDRLFSAEIGSLNELQYRFIDDCIYSASINAIDLSVDYLRRLNTNGLQGINNFIGFGLSNFSDIRVNESLGNAALSFDNLNNICVSFSCNKNFVISQKDKRFLGLIKYRRKEKHFLLNWNLGFPVYSLIYRQGFTNPGNSTSDTDSLFPGYAFTGKFFTGVDSDFSVIRLLKNGNGIKLSYNWKIFSSGRNKINTLNFSCHTILFGLIFKLN